MVSPNGVKEPPSGHEVNAIILSMHCICYPLFLSPQLVSLSTECILILYSRSGDGISHSLHNLSTSLRNRKRRKGNGRRGGDVGARRGSARKRNLVKHTDCPTGRPKNQHNTRCHEDDATRTHAPTHACALMKKVITYRGNPWFI